MTERVGANGTTNAPQSWSPFSYDEENQTWSVASDLTPDEPQPAAPIVPPPATPVVPAATAPTASPAVELTLDQLRRMKESNIAYQVTEAWFLPLPGLTYERIMSELPGVPFKDEVWPKFLRENAVRVFDL